LCRTLRLRHELTSDALKKRGDLSLSLRRMVADQLGEMLAASRDKRSRTSQPSGVIPYRAGPSGESFDSLDEARREDC
jgi:hypothetical protein